MSYKNVVFVKLFVKLGRDYRFTDKLNDSQKMLYMFLLLLAGMTDNEIPNDANWIKRTLNLQIPYELIELDLLHIRKVFDKLVCRNDLLQFVDWQQLHNFKIGVPILATEKRRVEKSKSRVREEKKVLEPPEQTKEQLEEMHKLTTELMNKLPKTVV